MTESFLVQRNLTMSMWPNDAATCNKVSLFCKQWHYATNYFPIWWNARKVSCLTPITERLNHFSVVGISFFRLNDSISPAFQLHRNTNKKALLGYMADGNVWDFHHKQMATTSPGTLYLVTSLANVGRKVRSVELSTRFLWQTHSLTYSLIHWHTNCPMML